MGKMEISEKILGEIKKYHQINSYITEQEALPTEPPAEIGAEVPPAPGAEPTPAAPAPETTTTPTPEPIDVANDPDVEKVGEEGKTEEETDELEITDLVNSQKNIEQKQEEYFNNLFSQLTNLESKLQDMNNVFDKLNQIEAKIEQYREKTPQEKLELRSLDSGPFNQKLTDFFSDKEEDMEKSGKNEYVLTSDEVEDFPKEQIRQSFTDYGNDNDFKEIKY